MKYRGFEDEGPQNACEVCRYKKKYQKKAYCESIDEFIRDLEDVPKDPEDCEYFDPIRESMYDGYDEEDIYEGDNDND